jgi:hypothetical protein
LYKDRKNRAELPCNIRGLECNAIRILYLNANGTISGKGKISATDSSFDLAAAEGDLLGEVITNAGESMRMV